MPTPSLTTGIAASNQDIRFTAQLRGRWLLIVRVVWLSVALLDIGLFVGTVPAGYAIHHKVATQPQVLTNLHDLGITPDTYASFQVAKQILVSLVCCAVAGVIFWRKSDEPMALFVGLFLITFGAAPAEVGLQTANGGWYLAAKFLRFLGLAALPAFFYLFPDGQFVPRWTRWLALAWAVQMLYFIFGPTLPEPANSLLATIGQFTYLGVLGSLVFAQVYRYLRVSGPEQRQQTKWLVFALLAVTLVAIGTFVMSLLSGQRRENGTAVSLVSATIVGLVLLLIPISIGMAILRWRLWNVDPLIQRTLVYGLLTALISGIYVLIVAGLGWVIHDRALLAVSLLATGVIAVVFQPLRDQLQRMITRLMYGQRNEPYTVLLQLGQRLEATLAPEAVLPTIVETIKDTLKLPYVAIALQQGDQTVLAAAQGIAQGTLIRLPLVYQSEVLGELQLAPRAPDEPLRLAEHQLLHDVARQTGIAAHAVRLTTDLQRANDELQRARTQLVNAREEERLRLRRDLHDGLGSVLASLNLRAGAIRTLLARDLRAADALVVEQQTTIRAAIADVRRLVHNLRPPALDELGLATAIRELVSQSAVLHSIANDHSSRLHADLIITEPLPPLTAAVEVAAYRIVQEALTNVVRHAEARHCAVRLAIKQDMLQIEIADDGVGLSSARQLGVGLCSMRERAEELGGTCALGRGPEGGTQVCALLPLSDKESLSEGMDSCRPSAS